MAELGKRYKDATDNEAERDDGDEGTFQRWCYGHRGLLVLGTAPWEIPLDAETESEPDGESEEGDADEDAEPDDDSDNNDVDPSEDSADDEAPSSDDATVLAGPKQILVSELSGSGGAP